jgi:hypothetical protein
MASLSETTPELRRVALLRAFKLQMLERGAENLSPFADRIATSHADAKRLDLSSLQAEVRDNIIQQIEAVHTHQRSHVILLSGEAGTGKTHIVRHFARADVAEKLGYIHVGGSNHWKVEEFQPCLLDWMIQAITAPSPSSDKHLLLERIRAIGFRALGQLLENRTALKRCLSRRRRGFIGRLLGRRRADYDTIARLTKARNPQVFRELDYSLFTDEVCNRFLAEPSNPIHRYALRVLLTYLFPDQVQTGVGTGERIIDWFRRKSDDGYWVRKLGVADDLSKRYAVADAVRLLIHLFSPELSSRLSVDGDECRSYVFLFVFDQAEGRDELFETLDDWNHFFAHLSELYNTLPNVLVLFTMTLGLRNELHPRMERQFKDRIRKDERFVLRQPTVEQVRELYRARLTAWLEREALTQGVYLELDESEQYLPFDAERVVEIGGRTSIRNALEKFDVAFREALCNDVVIEPEYDFEFVRNEQQAVIEQQSEYDYTLEHLDTVKQLIEPLQDELAAEYAGAHLTSIEEETLDSLRVLKLTFTDSESSTDWVCVYLARFGYVFAPHVARCRDLLFGKVKMKYSVWMVRPKDFTPSHDKPDQMKHATIPPDTEARLWAAVHLVSKRSEYTRAGTWASAWQIIVREIKDSYLHALFTHARDRLLARKASGQPDESVIS